MFGRTVNGHNLTIKPGEVTVEIINNLRDIMVGYSNAKLSTLYDAVVMGDHFSRAKLLYSTFRVVVGPTIGGLSTYIISSL